MNKQRVAIYAIRRELLEGVDQRDYLLELANDIAMELLEEHAPREKAPDRWDLEALRIAVGNQFGLDIRNLGLDLSDVAYDQLAETLTETVKRTYTEKENRVGSEFMRFQERMIMLQVLDAQWKDHLWALDHLKEGIGLRGYGQRDPLIEYKKESFEMFEALNARREEETIRYLFLFEPITREEQEARLREREDARHRQSREEDLVYSSSDTGTVVTRKREVAKVGRNDPCPCGSGKKFKKCHGR
jgi:preprotein translocase subunit SecA